MALTRWQPSGNPVATQWRQPVELAFHQRQQLAMPFCGARGSAAGICRLAAGVLPHFEAGVPLSNALSGRRRGRSLHSVDRLVSLIHTPIRRVACLHHHCQFIFFLSTATSKPAAVADLAAACNLYFLAVHLVVCAAMHRYGPAGCSNLVVVCSHLPPCTAWNAAMCPRVGLLQLCRARSTCGDAAPLIFLTPLGLPAQCL